jgi:hypothetical protein
MFDWRVETMSAYSEDETALRKMHVQCRDVKYRLCLSCNQKYNSC